MTRLAIALLPLCLACGCAALPQDGSAAPEDTRFTLGMGEARRLADNSLLTYVRLVDDSRCAPTVQCAWEGDAEIELRWQPARGSARELRLHTSPKAGPTAAAIGARSVALAGLERGIAPKATLHVRSTP